MNFDVCFLLEILIYLSLLDHPKKEKFSNFCAKDEGWKDRTENIGQSLQWDKQRAGYCLFYGLLSRRCFEEAIYYWLYCGEGTSYSDKFDKLISCAIVVSPNIRR